MVVAFVISADPSPTTTFLALHALLHFSLWDNLSFAISLIDSH
jgi:hypothetical protein